MELFAKLLPKVTRQITEEYFSGGKDTTKAFIVIYLMEDIQSFLIVIITLIMHSTYHLLFVIMNSPNSKIFR